MATCAVHPRPPSTHATPVARAPWNLDDPATGIWRGSGISHFHGISHQLPVDREGSSRNGPLVSPSRHEGRWIIGDGTMRRIFAFLFLFGADQTRLALSIFAVLPSLCDSSPLTSLLVEFERVPSEAATGRYILFPAPQSRLGWPLSFTFALSAALAGEGNCAQ